MNEHAQSDLRESHSIWFESRDEFLRVLVAGICFFCVLSSYYLIRPIREQLGAASGGSAALPRLYAIVFASMLILTPIYGALVSKFSRRIFVPIVYCGFVLAFIGLKWFVGQPFAIDTKAVLVFVYVSVFNLFVVSVFWSCMADCFTAAQAKRFFGYVAFAGSLGAFLAPKVLLPAIIKNYGLDVAYWVSGCLMLVALGALLVMFQFSAQPQTARSDGHANEPIGGNWLAGAQATFASPFMRRMVILMLCGDAVATILYTQISDYAKVTYPIREESALFFANVDAMTNLTIMLLQLGVAAFAIRRFGASKTMAVPSLIAAIFLFSIAATEAVTLMVMAMVVSRGGSFGVVGPARESTFARVDRETRFKAKNFLDTAVWRFGDLIMVSLVNVLVKFGADVRVFACISGTAALIAVFVAWRIEKHLPDAKQP